MRGRPRKAGKRTASGALKRDGYPVPSFDRGSEWVQSQRAKYGEHYGSALGRAYAGGLLGDAAEAKTRLDVGKRFDRLHGAIIVQGRYRCPLNDTPRGISRDQDRDDRSGYDWLFSAMSALDKAGLRPWLDQLLSPEYLDQGPVWLTRLLRGGKDPYDRAMLKRAIEALDEIAPRTKNVLIVAQTY